jgi:ribA/ribD-fused uncharacterized protein
MITEFKDEYRFLSNFNSSPIVWKGTNWPTVEHAYQAAKTNDVSQRLTIQHAATPGKAKRLGRAVTLRKDWDTEKVPIMKVLVRKKFTQNIGLRMLLFITADEELAEGNHWHDNFWGNCLCNKCEHIKGKNMLGKILMEVRSNIQKRCRGE